MATATARSSSAIHDPHADHLLTPQNAALVVIDYQPSQLAEDTSPFGRKRPDRRERPPDLPSPGPSAYPGIVNDRSLT
jgi:hypothetical protein